MKIISDLENSKRITLTYFNLPEEDMVKIYGQDKWSVRQILHHLADAESVLYDRIRRAIANPGQVVWGFDQDKWATELDYNHMPLNLSREIFTAVRNGIIYRARLHYESDGDKILIHSSDGKKTLEDLFDKVVWHCQGHLDQIGRALDQEIGVIRKS